MCRGYEIEGLGRVVGIEILLTDSISIIAKNINAVVMIEITVPAQIHSYAIVFVTLLQRQGSRKREIVKAMRRRQALDKRVCW